MVTNFSILCLFVVFSFFFFLIWIILTISFRTTEKKKEIFVQTSETSIQSWHKMKLLHVTLVVVCSLTSAFYLSISLILSHLFFFLLPRNKKKTDLHPLR